jgi:hypothetical protein
MKDWEAQTIFGAVVSVAITVGLVIYEKQSQASAAAAASNVAQSGTAATQTLSLSGQKSFTVTVPTGAQFTASSSLSPTIVSASGMTFTAVSQGNAFVTVSWNDASGTPQKTTIPVVVTA